MKAQAKAIIASVVVIALALTALSGVTYSWWSDSENSTINITTGTLEVSTSNYTVTGSSLKTNTGNITANTLPSNINLNIDNGIDYSNENNIFIKNDANFSSLDLTISYNVKFSADVPYRYIINVDTPTGVYATVTIDGIQEALPLEEEGSDRLDRNYQITVKINAIDSGINTSAIQFTNYITQQANNALIVNITGGSANIPSTTQGQPAIITGTITDITTSEIVSIEASFNNIPTDAKSFNVSSSKDRGTGITTLNLSVEDTSGNPISNTGTVSIKVELPGNVQNPQVIYNGSSGIQPTIKGSSYNEITGKTTVIFETEHFSEYLIFDYSDPMQVSDGETLRLFMENGINCKLNAKININSPLMIDGQKVTLDLNGYSIVSEKSGLYVKNSSDVTIMDSSNRNGSLKAGMGDQKGSYVALKSDGDSTVLIKGGYFFVNCDEKGLGNSCIETVDSWITITGGTFETAADYNNIYFVLNIAQTQGGNYGFKVIGGKFINYDPATGDDNLGGTFVVEGYSVQSHEESGKTYYEVVKNIAYIEDTGYSSLSSAIAASSEGDVITIYESGTYTLPTVPNKITIAGYSKDIVINTTGPNNESIASIPNGITFKNISFINSNVPYRGFYGAGDIIFDDCIINGKLTCYSKTSFLNSTINLNSTADYIWTYGQDVVFDNCIFYTLGKAILIYDENGYGTTFGDNSTVSVTNCKFNASKGATAGEISNQNCAAIEINNFGKGVILTTNNNTVQKGDDAFSGEWRIKLHFDDDLITVNGTQYDSTALDGKYFTVVDNNVITQQS